MRSLETVSILIQSGTILESADDDGDYPLMELLLFHSDDSLELVLETGAEYTRIDSNGDHVLRNVAI